MTEQQPFLLNATDLEINLADAVDAVFDSLTSQFLVFPKGDAFLEYSGFRAGYEALRLATGGFETLTVETCWDALRKNAVAWIVIRAILGISPPEWGDLTNEHSDANIPANWCRKIDGDAKRDHAYFTSSRSQTELNVARVTACLAAAVDAIKGGAEETPEAVIHRLDKLDTRHGLASVRHVAEFHVPYAVLLYERYLGRPLASHRDAVSELIGDVMETAIESLLADAHIPFRKTKRAERVPGFEQAPDFFAPDEIEPTVIIEAKICGDDGTARDKVSRILRLASMRDDRIREGKPSFEVVACIDGRGFGVRREDMRQLLVATKGKVFTMATLPELIDNTALKHLRP